MPLLLIAGCDSSAPATSLPGPSESLPSSAGTPPVDGLDAKAILDEAFGGNQALGSGFGRLRQDVSNTLASTPADVLGVTFAFTCTGDAKVTVKVAVAGKQVPLAAGTLTCDKSVFQQSVETPQPGAISFEANVAGSTDGSFAYAYFPEKKAP